MLPVASQSSPLMDLPVALLREHILRKLDAISLLNLELTAKAFRQADFPSKLPLTDAAAMYSVLQLCDGDTAFRWRQRNWKERLHLQCIGTGFDLGRGAGSGFKLTPAAGDKPARVDLEGMGPKLLVSDASTKECPVLRWQLCITGNTALEFGVVPVELQDQQTALHKCMAVSERSNARAVGFASQITAGSKLSFKAPVMRGTTVEILARRGRVEFLIDNPKDAKEVQWRNGQPVQRPYRGPLAFRFEQEFPADYDVKLAVTCWAKGSFLPLHFGQACPLGAAEAAAPVPPPPPTPVARIIAQPVGTTCAACGRLLCS